ncbi:hypothetical protein [Caldimonas tepidiphila]|uniref:hypothetical protein n=1 Tax=Caldimonas tepidiphila TaxID=2315841 RepID=UPI001300A392|nr:hypothetical protein [Caldimonas tepidiphila]
MVFDASIRRRPEPVSWNEKACGGFEFWEFTRSERKQMKHAGTASHAGTQNILSQVAQ